MKTFVYALFDPRKPDVFQYIGQTAQLETRMRRHSVGSDSITREWVMSLLADGVLPSYSVLLECDEWTAGATEAAMITRYAPPLNTRVVSLAFKVDSAPLVSMAEMEKRYIAYALASVGGNKLACAKALCMGRQTLYNKLRNYGLR